jgi:hypothetical protein
MGFLGFPHGLCEVKTVQKYLVNQKLSFPVAPKSETTLSIRETIYVSKETILITALLAVGSTLVNPLGVVTRGVACRHSQPETVNLLLDSVGTMHWTSRFFHSSAA